MKIIYYSITLLFLVLGLSGKSYAKVEYPEVSGPYFGQKPPGLAPELFAPNIISVGGQSEYGMSFTPDLHEMYFTVQKKYGVPAAIYFSKFEGNKWSALTKANFTKGKKAGEMETNVTLDGSKIFFTAYNTDFSDTKIWYANRLNNGWSDAIKLDATLNQDEVMTSTLAKNGDLYYTNLSKSFRTYYSPNVNGKYPKFFKADIAFGGHGSISPLQDYLIVDSRHKEDKNRKDADFYVYFKRDDGSWGKPINLGPEINSTFDETVATFTPDGKYLFFSRRTEGDNLDLYWVSTKVIERLRPKN